MKPFILISTLIIFSSIVCFHEIKINKTEKNETSLATLKRSKRALPAVIPIVIGITKLITAKVAASAATLAATAKVAVKVGVVGKSLAIASKSASLIATGSKSVSVIGTGAKFARISIRAGSKIGKLAFWVAKSKFAKAKYLATKTKLLKIPQVRWTISGVRVGGWLLGAFGTFKNVEFLFNNLMSSIMGK